MLSIISDGEDCFPSDIIVVTATTVAITVIAPFSFLDGKDDGNTACITFSWLDVVLMNDDVTDTFYLFYFDVLRDLRI